uniref:Uncharacterized protein n=1 Tax=Leersia perrieri TaxID=77586 RepID=A0A0D9VVL1_9ORYZ
MEAWSSAARRLDGGGAGRHRAGVHRRGCGIGRRSGGAQVQQVCGVRKRGPSWLPRAGEDILLSGLIVSVIQSLVVELGKKQRSMKVIIFKALHWVYIWPMVIP